MTNLEQYKQIFMETFSLTEEQVNDELVAGNVADWDSVGHINLITAIEDTFDIMMDTEDILNFKSFAIGKEILTKYDVIV